MSDHQPDAGDEVQVESFFDALTGKPVATSAPATARLLREALLAEQRTLDEVERPGARDLDDTERAMMAHHLDGVGRIVPWMAPASGQARQRSQAAWWRRLLDGVTGPRWQGGAALAFGVLMASVLVISYERDASVGRPEDAVRGAVSDAESPTSHMVLTSSTPERTAVDLMHRIAEAGGHAVVVESQPVRQWIVQINEPSAQRLNAVRNVLTESGLQAVPEFPLTVVIEMPPGQ